MQLIENILYYYRIYYIIITSSGLQTLIDKADSYLKSHGLIFNSQKTECMMSGLNPFNVVPNWTIDNVTLQVVPSISGYLLGSNHTLSVLKRVRCVTPQNENGLIDSVRTLICNYNDKNRYMLKQLLKTYK